MHVIFQSVFICFLGELRFRLFPHKNLWAMHAYSGSLIFWRDKAGGQWRNLLLPR